MHSHRAEIFGVLSVLTFLKEYCIYFLIELNSPVKYYCDKILVNSNAFDRKYKRADHDTVLQLKICLPKTMKIHNIFLHQDKSKDKYLTLQTKLNIRANKLISSNIRKPLQTNIINTPMVLIRTTNTSLINTTSKSDP